MDDKIKIEITPERIEGFCKIYDASKFESVISFSLVSGDWYTSCSICIPTNIEDAKIVIECYRRAIKHIKLEKF